MSDKISDLLEKTESARRSTQEIFDLYGADYWRDACRMLDFMKEKAEKKDGIVGKETQVLLSIAEMSVALVGLEMAVNQLLKHEGEVKRDGKEKEV